MQEKITKQELLTEMKVALEDEFVASVTEEEDGIALRFLNGQKFRLSVEEVKE